MALQRSIFLGTYRAAAGDGYVLKVQQGGHKQYSINEYRFHTGALNSVKNISVFNGDIYIPNGKTLSGAYGHVAYSPDLDQFYQVTGSANDSGPIPFGDRVVWFASGYQGWGYSPKSFDYKTGSSSSQDWSDWARLGNQLFLLDQVNSNSHIWTYPFTNVWINRVPSTAGYKRICELKGEMYCLSVVSSGTSQLMKWNAAGSIWQNLPNTFTWPVDNTKIASNQSSNTLLFKYNNKIWAGIVTTTTGAARIRIVQLSETTGSIVQDANALGWMPAIWNMASFTGTNGDKIFEIRDDTGSSEQVFLVRCGDTTYGGWEMYEFQEAAFTLVDSGLEYLSPYAGIIYDENTKSAEIKSIADTIPSNYATINVTTGDLMNNGTVNIDPRYRDLSAPTVAIPYDAMTEKTGVGSCGKTSIPSKPSGITVLTDLDDDFSDMSIDADLWEPVSPAIYNNTTDVGCLHATSGFAGTISLVESAGGELVFGATGDTGFTNYVGRGVQSKWVVSGAFSVDIAVNPAALISSVSHGLFGIMKVSTGIGYGFQVYNDGVNKRARGLFMQKNTNIAFNGVSTAVVASGTVIRIARDGSNVWSVRLDPSGANENILDDLSGLLPYSEDVHLWLFAHSITGAWAAVTWPAIQSVKWSGAGSLARYRHVRSNNFMWDHITDLGSDKTLTAETYTDVVP